MVLLLACFGLFKGWEPASVCSYLYEVGLYFDCGQENLVLKVVVDLADD